MKKKIKELKPIEYGCVDKFGPYNEVMEAMWELSENLRSNHDKVIDLLRKIKKQQEEKNK
jgi:hypothetical protein